MSYSGYTREAKDAIMHGAVIAVILVFWTLVSQTVAYGMTAANLNTGIASSLANALYTVGLANVVLYVLNQAAKTYRQ